MTPNAPDDANVLVIPRGLIPLGCPVAGAQRQSWSPVPTLPQRATFAPITPPAQSRSLGTFPRSGTFILFQLDKIKLAEQLLPPGHPGPPELCQSFPTKQYVGLVLGPFRGGDSSEEEYVIAFVSKSLPPGSKFDAEYDSFAVPIVPMKRENAGCCPPLRPKLFPWTKCYQYTAFGTRATLTNTYHSAIDYELCDEDFSYFDERFAKDHTKLARQQHDMSLMSGEEAMALESMRVPDTALPVKVWQELRAVRECHDPREFVQEVLDFKELVLATAKGFGPQ